VRYPPIWSAARCLPGRNDPLHNRLFCCTGVTGRIPRNRPLFAFASPMCDYRTMSGGAEWADVGERMRLARLAAGFTQEELGAKAGLDRTMIVKIESGDRRIDAMELVRLSSALQVPVDFLLRSAPLVLSRRTSVTAEDADTEVARESGRLDLALVAWLHDVQQMVELGALQPGPLLMAKTVIDSEAAARDLALWVREQLGAGSKPINSLVELCERAGQYVLVTDVPGEGSSVVDGGVAVAVVSLRGDPGRRRATAAHELGHLVIGDEYSSDLGVHASRGEREALLDAFAAELLLPSQALTGESGASECISRDQLIGLAARYRTSWSLAIRQATQAGVLSGQARHDWGRSSPTRSEFLEAIGWAPQPDLEAIRVPPHYAHAVMVAWRNGAITATRAAELMHGQITKADLPVGPEVDAEP
jgi:transcriptional regulator with XRE-family HTH domain/Zn-dependent peptidase ImmA (M78 family)